MKYEVFFYTAGFRDLNHCIILVSHIYYISSRCSVDFKLKMIGILIYEMKNKIKSRKSVLNHEEEEEHNPLLTVVSVLHTMTDSCLNIIIEDKRFKPLNMR